VTWDDLEKKLGDLRTALDEADDCKFGQMGKFLDALAKMTDEAMAGALLLRQETEAQK